MSTAVEAPTFPASPAGLPTSSRSRGRQLRDRLATILVWAAFLVVSPVMAFASWNRFRARIRALSTGQELEPRDGHPAAH